MAWWKTFPSPLLLLSFVLLAINTLNTPSHAFHPTHLSLSTHTREYAVYANEHGVPKLERGDNPAKDPQIIQDSPIPTVTPTVLPPSPTPVSDADASSAQPSSTPLPSEQAAAADVSEHGTDASSAHAAPTVSEVGSASPSVKPSASASSAAPPASPTPFTHSSPPSGGESGAVHEHVPSHDDPFDDDLHLSATAEELDVESESTDSTNDQPSEIEGTATQPLFAAEPVAVSAQSVASDAVLTPAPSPSPGEHGPAFESTKPIGDEEEEEEEPFESPLVDDVSFSPTPTKTAVPPGMKNTEHASPSVLLNSKAPVQLHLEDELPTPKPEPSQSVSPVPSPVQAHAEEESSPSGDHPVLDTSNLDEDDQSLQSSFEDEIVISEEEAVPVAVETEGSDKSVSGASAAPVATAIAPPTSSEPSASAATVVDEASSEAQSPDVVGNVEVDESFTCTYFGKGSIPNFENPDENNFTGKVSTFAVSADDFPELAPQYLSHVYGASWSYSFSVDELFAYDVVLGFAEVYDGACKAGEGSGYRIFNTWVGDQTTKIDVMGIVGCGKPLQKVYPKITPSGNTITLVFKQVSQKAMLSTMCYRKAGAVNSKSPATEPKPSPVQESHVIATAIPPTSSVAEETATVDEEPDSIPEEEAKPSGIDSQPGSLYKCVNFGLEGISGYEMYNRNEVSGDAHVFAGSGQYKNTLPEPYWYYMHGQDWSYSLEVSSTAPQNLVLGYAETSSDSCDMDREFTVSANGGVQTANVTESVKCGVIYQIELEGVIPVNGVIDLSFVSFSGDALVSVLCFADTSETKPTPITAMEPTPEASMNEAAEETPAPPEEANAESTSAVAQSDFSDEEDGSGGSCFSFSQNTVPGFLSASSLPQGVSYYSDMKASVSGAPQEGSVFSSHIYGSHFSLKISNKDQAPKSVFIGLAEIYEPACNENQRLFSVTVGSLTKTIDVFKEVGCSAALVLKIVEVTPDDANNIEIDFTGVKDNAMISAVCVTDSDGNSLGKPSASLVSKLPPLSILNNSATLTIASEEPQSKPVETPAPSLTVDTVSVTDADLSEVEEPQPDGTVGSDENEGENPKGSPYPEVNGLIDATVMESPATAASNVGTNPLSGSEEGVDDGDPAHVVTSTNDSEGDEAHNGDILLPNEFSQTTFGEVPVVASSSPMGLSSDETASDAPMHPTDSDSGGFPQSAAVEDIDSKQVEDGISSESSEVIVVLEENVVPSLSPSATSSPTQNLESGTDGDQSPQAIQPSLPPSPIPTSGVIIVPQGGNPVEQSSSPSETLVPSASPDSGVIVSVGSGGEEQESPTPLPATEVTLAVEEEGLSQGSLSSPTPYAAPSSTPGSTVVLVSEIDDPAIPSTPEEAAVTIVDTESDGDDEPIPSLMPMEEGLEDIPTAIPPGGSSTGLGSNDEVSSNDSDDSVVLALDSDPVAVSVDSEPSPSLAPTPVSVAIPPNAAAVGTESDERDEVQVLVPDAQETTSVSPSSENDATAVVIAVDATDISSLQPTPSPVAATGPAATVTNNQIEIEVPDTPTPTPSPTSASSSGDDVDDVVIFDGEASDTSSVEAPDGVSLGGASDGSSSNLDGATSVSPSPTPSLIVSVTGSDTVIISTTGAEASPIPASTVVPVAAPEAVAEVPDTDAEAIQVSETENAEPVDSALTGDEKVPSIIEGEYKELIGTVPAGNGFSIGMGILGALLVLLLLVLLFFAIRSDGVAYSYSSQYSSRKPSDYGDASQGGYTEGLNQDAAGYQNESYAGDGASGYASGQPLMESRPVEGSENFGYEKPEEGLGGVSGSYGNVGPDTYAAYSSLNLQDGPTTIGEETNMYTQSATMTMEGHMFHNGSGTRDTTFSGTGIRESEQPTEYGEATTLDHTEITSHGVVPTSMMDETLHGASEFEQRISMFGGRRGSHGISSGQDTRGGNSFRDNRSVARPNFESASSGNQGREYGMVLQGTGYETVTKEERDQYKFMQEADVEHDSPDVTDTRIGSGLEGSEQVLSMSSTPTAAPSPYETDMRGQLATDSDSGKVSYQNSPVLASESASAASAASADIGSSRVLRRARSGDIYKDSVLDDYRHNESGVRESARHGHGTMELQSDLSNDGPWPWWWSDQKDQEGIFEQSSGPAPDVFDKENSSLPSNNQSPVEQSSSGLSTDDAKAAVAVADTMILKPSEIARLGHLPTTSASKWQRQYSSTSDGTSRERFENNPYFDELRKRREPYVKTVANRLSTGVKAYSTESGESLLEQARKEFEEQHSQQPSLGFNDNDPSSWVTQGVEV